MRILFLSILLITISSCGKETGPAPAKGASEPQAKITSKQDNSEATKPAGDSFPAISQLGQGEFTAEGMADVFQTVIGVPMDSVVTPIAGKYAVWNEKDYGNKNRSTVLADYTTTPENSALLLGQIKSGWQAKYGTLPDFSISETKWDNGGLEGIEGRTNFGPGTIVLIVSNRYTSYHEICFKVILDRTSGNFHIWSYRGTENTPGERENPESK